MQDRVINPPNAACAAWAPLRLPQPYYKEVRFCLRYADRFACLAGIGISTYVGISVEAMCLEKPAGSDENTIALCKHDRKGCGVVLPGELNRHCSGFRVPIQIGFHAAPDAVGREKELTTSA
jgi:hypothetical protein